MAKRKRKSNGLDNNDMMEASSAKQPRHQDAASPIQSQQSVSYGRVDPTYGQRSAIPGLDEYSYNEVSRDGEDEGLEWGDEGDALRYLRSVRAEASTIPTLLVAPPDPDDEEDNRRALYDNGVGDARGWYEDGAYTGAPNTESHEIYEQEDTQQRYYNALLRRFMALREQLAQTPPRHVVERLDGDHSSYMANTARDYRMWRWRLRHTSPVAGQVAGMDKATVVRLLRMVGEGKGRFLAEQDRARRRKMGLWMWALLARLPERGELVSEEVGVVREVGKRAVWVVVERGGGDMGGFVGGGQEHEEEEKGEGEEEEEVVLDVEVDISDGGGCVSGDQVVGKDAKLVNSGSSGGGGVYSHSDGHATLEAPTLIPPINTIGGIIGPMLPDTSMTMTENPSNGSNVTSLDVTSTTTNHATETEVASEDLATARARLLARLDPTRQMDNSIHASLDDGLIRNGHAGDGEGAVPCDEEVGYEDGDWDYDKMEEEEEGGDEQEMKVLLDMVITVAGEVYGQRDLLEFREAWV